MKKIKSPLYVLLAAILFIGIGNIYSQSCPEGLVSYWKMDETNGNTFVDLAGGNDATLHNFTVNSVTGKVDGANYFTYTDGIGDGEGQYATAPDNAMYSFPAGSGFTISYWLKFTETQYGLHGGQDHLIISKGDWNDGDPSEAFWASGVNGSGFVSFMLRDNSKSKRDLEGRVYGQDNFNDGQWHHVACVRNSVTNYSTIYVDGRITDQQYDEFQDDWDNSNPVYIGSLTNTTPQYFYWGSMDELSVFNKALTKAEIDEIRANADLGTGLCNLIASPDITTTPVTTANVGSIYLYKVHAKGTQTNMTYSLITKPTGMTIGASTGEISWTPSTVDVDGLVSVKADNGIAPADTQTFRIYISAGGSACPSGLLALYRLDETSGETYADYEGAHDATVPSSYPAPTPTTGIIGGAQTFGATTRVDIPDNGTEFEWNANASFSFESWIKTTATGVAAISRNRVDIDHVLSWWIGVNPNGYGIMELRDNAGTNTVLPGNNKKVNDGQWHHIVGVRDGDANMNKLYVDGVLDSAFVRVFPDDFVAPAPLVVGIGYLTPWSGENELHFTGDLDETAIFNRALTAEEVASFYNNGNPKGHCNDANYAPAITSTPLKAAKEDMIYSYTMVVDDINATDTLTLSAPTKPSWLNFSWTPGSKTAVLSGTPTNDNVGNVNIVLRVTDNKTIRNQSFTLQVTNTQDALVITSTPITSAMTDVSYSYTITVTDVDVSDTINMSVVTKPSWLTFNYTPGSKTGTLTGTPGNANVGNNAVNISITDKHVTLPHSFTINVIQSNTPPVITNQTSLSVNKNGSILIEKSSLTINDVDNAAGDISIKVLAGTNYSYSGNLVTPATDYTGQLTVNVRAYDLVDSSDIYPLIITVIPTVAGPVITSVPDTSVAAGGAYIYIFTTDDDDNSTITKSALIKPSWLSFSANVGILSGIPSTGDIGKHQVVLKATNGTESVYQQFYITVTPKSAVAEFKDNAFVIYPVPVQNELNIRFRNLADETTIEIVSTTGCVIESMNIPANTDIATLPTDQLEAGLYIIRIFNNTINETNQIMIVK